jgi:hypothetical protein
MSGDRLTTELPECSADAVLLDESSYSTDIHEFVKYLVNQGVAETEFRPRLIQWVADSLKGASQSCKSHFENCPLR